MPPRNWNATVDEELLNDAMNKAADAASEGANGSDDKDAKDELKKCWSGVFKSKEFGAVMDKGEDYARRRLNEGADPIKLVGELASWLFDGVGDSITKAVEAKTNKEMLKQILKGIVYSLCLVAAVMILITIGVVALVGAIVLAIMKGVWKVIKTVTGFIWDVFKKAIKEPGFWAGITVAGMAGIAVCPPVGIIVAAVGAFGTFVTADN